MENWLSAVSFLRSEGFKDSSIVEVLDEIRGIGMHKYKGVDEALFEYLSKVIISENTELKLPMNIYIRPLKSCTQALNKLIYSILEEKHVTSKSYAEQRCVYSNNKEKALAALGESFLKAFHLVFCDNPKEAMFRFIFEEQILIEDGQSYLLAHEFESLNNEEIKFYQKVDCDLLLVASIESSVGSRMKLAIESKIPLLCELFEETDFLDKYYFSDELLIELQERSKNKSAKEAG